MASIYDLKPRFQARLRPYVEALAEAGITANMVTATALVLSVVWGLWIGSVGLATPAMFLLPLILFVRMALNAVDGMLAREHDQKTRFGALFNELADIASDAALYMPMALLPGVPGWLLILTVMLGLIAEMAGAIARQIGASRRYDGPFGKSDRAVFFGLFGELWAIGLVQSWAWIYLLAGCALALWCLVNRIRRALAEAET
jgi:CDP-diacylglycerol--glycerol-3-phosphate 3-phosphatidyltransferase